MAQAFSRRCAFVGASLLSLLAGCASMAVTDDAIEQKTAFALGVPKGSFTISDRVNEGMQTNYSVRTNTGKQYSCYVTGTISTVGRVVSDAVCNGASRSGGPAPKPAASETSCNALLKAAGRC
ncbi:hypothetical protein [Variovorax ginsengisoli]|uniref:Lipoprotein n=1 Tax=Variovorax ginsengisoli TaxID=363844 RepID=A0ABT9SEY7_9BURK|nr:hypothetical protein [Variovorax ginsengisoli]MDP9902934.1 hypothetical protein [Variovorax ginsengisoli]